jgi:hypothetical protein
VRKGFGCGEVKFTDVEYFFWRMWVRKVSAEEGVRSSRKHNLKSISEKPI